MSELENIKSLEKYDQWKKAKASRKSWISFIASIIGAIVSYLLISTIVLKVGFSDILVCGKAIFAEKSEIAELWPKIQEVDNKMKKSILAKPLNFASEKITEQAGKQLLTGNFEVLHEAASGYSLILVFAWWCVLCLLFYLIKFLSKWIISKYVWHEPTLSEQEIE